MKLLFDSHVLLWAIYEPEKLTSRVADLVSDTNNELHISLATVWELSNKAAAYRLPLAGSSVEDMVARFEELQPVFVSITRADINRAATLPQHHGDPFDRMLIAQAQALSLTLLTKDGKIMFYDVATIWQ